jgi:hypothetical protein
MFIGCLSQCGWGRSFCKSPAFGVEEEPGRREARIAYATAANRLRRLDDGLVTAAARRDRSVTAAGANAKGRAHRRTRAGPLLRHYADGRRRAGAWPGSVKQHKSTKLYFYSRSGMSPPMTYDRAMLLEGAPV